MLSTLHNERDHQTIMALTEKPVINLNGAEKPFSDLLTPYAFDCMKKQIALKEML